MAAEHAPPPSKSLGTEGQTPWAQYHEEKACFPCASAYSRWKNDLAYLDGGLLVGGRSPALCPYNLKRLGVTHILPVMDTYGRPEQFTGFQYFVVDVEDWSECGEAMAGKWDQAFQFIEQAKGERGRVFVHCFAGR